MNSGMQEKSYVKIFVNYQMWRVSNWLWWRLSPLAIYALHRWFISDYPECDRLYMATREALWSYVCGDGLVRSIRHGMIYLKPRL